MKRGVIFGVFDLIHVGHVKVLEKAKIYCELLTVCVFSDRITRKYKHRKPVIPESERLQMVSSLKCVDVAHLIDFRSPIDMKEMDIYFVSEELKGKKLFMVPENRICDVIYLPYTKEISTTKVIKRCQNTHLSLPQSSEIAPPL